VTIGDLGCTATWRNERSAGNGYVWLALALLATLDNS
jgi:hypothetical protein